MNRVRAALLRLAPPWRRRHPVVLATVERVTIRSNATDNWRVRPDYYVVERDPTDEAGA